MDLVRGLAMNYLVPGTFCLLAICEKSGTYSGVLGSRASNLREITDVLLIALELNAHFVGQTTWKGVEPSSR